MKTNKIKEEIEKEIRFSFIITIIFTIFMLGLIIRFSVFILWGI